MTFAALLPVKLDPAPRKFLFGAAHSLLAVGLIFLGGYKLFCRIMSVFAALLFCCIFYCLFHLEFSLWEVVKGLTVPTLPTLPTVPTVPLADANSLSSVAAPYIKV